MGASKRPVELKCGKHGGAGGGPVRGGRCRSSRVLQGQAENIGFGSETWNVWKNFFAVEFLKIIFNLEGRV